MMILVIIKICNKCLHIKLAMKFHPDRNKENVAEAQKKFIEIGKAYDL